MTDNSKLCLSSTGIVHHPGINFPRARSSPSPRNRAIPRRERSIAQESLIQRRAVYRPGIAFSTRRSGPSPKNRAFPRAGNPTAQNRAFPRAGSPPLKNYEFHARAVHRSGCAIPRAGSPPLKILIPTRRAVHRPGIAQFPRGNVTAQELRNSTRGNDRSPKNHISTLEA